jgi:hypothetical protein
MGGCLFEECTGTTRMMVTPDGWLKQMEAWSWSESRGGTHVKSSSNCLSKHALFHVMSTIHSDGTVIHIIK